MRLLYTLNSICLYCSHDDRCFINNFINKKGEKARDCFVSYVRNILFSLMSISYIRFSAILVDANLITFSLPFFLLEVILVCDFPVYSFLFCSSVPCFSTLILVRLLGFLMLHSIYHLFYIVPAPRSSPYALPYIRSAFIITHTSSLTRFFTLIRHVLRSCVSCKLPRQFPPQTLLHQNAQTGISGFSRISRTEWWSISRDLKPPHLPHRRGIIGGQQTRS